MPPDKDPHYTKAIDEKDEYFGREFTKVGGQNDEVKKANWALQAKKVRCFSAWCGLAYAWPAMSPFAFSDVPPPLDQDPAARRDKRESRGGASCGASI